MTVTLLRGSDLIGRAVVDASTGDDLAEIKDVVFTTGRGAITGFTLRRRGFFGRRLKTVLPIDAVLSVRTDAVMVADADAMIVPCESAVFPRGDVVVLPGRGHNSLLFDPESISHVVDRVKRAQPKT